MGPFGHVGAAVEGNPVANGNTVTRDIYVVDDAAGSGTGVTLYVYTKTDEVASTGDMVSVNLAQSVALPLQGGSNTKTYMAGDNGLLYVGNNQTNGYVQIDESNLINGLGGGFSPPEGDSSITTDKYGYVTVTSYNNNTYSSGFYSLDPTGHLAEDGGGSDFMLDTTNGISTGNGNFISYPTETNPATRMKKRLGKTALSDTLAASNVATPIDYGFFTTYNFLYSYTAMEWVTCGYFQDGSDGCYGAGRLEPFGHIGAAIEGNEVANGNTVTRNIYVVGDAEGSGSGVTLYVYTKKDTFTLDEDKVTMNLTGTLTLPLIGGSHTQTFMASGNGFLYIGTNQGASAIQVRESNLAYASIAGSSTSGDVSSITTNAYGYVTITSTESNGSNNFDVYGPTGFRITNDDGSDFMLGASNGISTSDGNLMSAATKPNLAKRMKTRFDNATPLGVARH
ncbi:hypothetical protein B0E48_08960 [Rhodanobacter sp. C03]|nr:hypothetical protein B0E48_08960 [Rhodanobacter sp. C03]